MKRVATSDLAEHTRVYHNPNSTVTGILLRIAGARSCIKVVVPNVIGTVRDVAHQAHTPFNGIKQLHRLIMKLFENFTHLEWEPHDSAPTKRSHKLMYLRNLVDSAS